MSTLSQLKPHIESVSALSNHTSEIYTQAYALFCSHRERAWSHELFERSLNTPFSFVAYLSADAERSQPNLVGYIMVSQVLDEAEIEDVCIDLNYRNRGLAAALISHCVKALQKTKVSCLRLEVRESNEPAIALYEKMGFVFIAKRANYYSVANSNQMQDALVYQLSF